MSQWRLSAVENLYNMTLDTVSLLFSLISSSWNLILWFCCHTLQTSLPPVSWRFTAAHLCAKARRRSWANGWINTGASRLGLLWRLLLSFPLRILCATELYTEGAICNNYFWWLWIHYFNCQRRNREGDPVLYIQSDGRKCSGIKFLSFDKEICIKGQFINLILIVSMFLSWFLTFPRYVSPYVWLVRSDRSIFSSL